MSNLAYNALSYNTQATTVTTGNFPVPTTVGNSIIAVVTISGVIAAPTVTVQENNSSGTTFSTTTANFNSASGMFVGLYWDIGTTASVTNLYITCDSSQNISVEACEFVGIASEDVFGTSFGTTVSSLTPPATTTTVPNELGIVGCGWSNNALPLSNFSSSNLPVTPIIAEENSSTGGMWIASAASSGVGFNTANDRFSLASPSNMAMILAWFKPVANFIPYPAQIQYNAQTYSSGSTGVGSATVYLPHAATGSHIICYVNQQVSSAPTWTITAGTANQDSSTSGLIAAGSYYAFAVFSSVSGVSSVSVSSSNSGPMTVSIAEITGGASTLVGSTYTPQTQGATAPDTFNFNANLASTTNSSLILLITLPNSPMAGYLLQPIGKSIFSPKLIARTNDTTNTMSPSLYFGLSPSTGSNGMAFIDTAAGNYNTYTMGNVLNGSSSAPTIVAYSTPYTLIQSNNSGIQTPLSTNTTATATYNGLNNASGNMLLCGIVSGTAISGVTDSAGNTWSRVTSDVVQGSYTTSMWKVLNCKASSGTSPNYNTVTVSFTSNNPSISISLYEYKGPTSVRAIGTGTGTGTSPSVTTSTSALNNELVFGLVNEQNAGNNSSTNSGQTVTNTDDFNGSNDGYASGGTLITGETEASLPANSAANDYNAVSTSSSISAILAGTGSGARGPTTGYTTSGARSFSTLGAPAGATITAYNVTCYYKQTLAGTAASSASKFRMDTIRTISSTPTTQTGTTNTGSTGSVAWTSMSAATLNQSVTGLSAAPSDTVEIRFYPSLFTPKSASASMTMNWDHIVVTTTYSTTVPAAPATVSTNLTSEQFISPSGLYQTAQDGADSPSNGPSAQTASWSWSNSTGPWAAMVATFSIPAAAQNLTRLLTDTVNSIDQGLRSFIGYRMLIETISAITDTIGRTWGTTTLITENLAFGTGQVGTYENRIGFIFPGYFTPGGAFFGTTHVPFLVDTANRLLSQQGLSTETLALILSILTNSSIFRILLETVSAIDTRTSMRGAVRTLSDVVGLSDLLNRQVLYGRLTPEQTAVVDTMSQIGAVTRTLSTTLGTISDMVARTIVNNRMVNEVVGTILDTLGGSTIINRLIPLEVEVVTDLLTTTRGSISSTRTLLETITTSDIVSRVTTINRLLSETTALILLNSQSQGVSRQLADAITSSDTLTRTQSIRRLMAEIAAINDLLLRSAMYGRTPTEVISLSDLLVPSNQYLRLSSETISVNDILVRNAIIVRVALELVTTVGTLSRTVGAMRSSLETTIDIDTIVRVTNEIRILTETLSLVTALFRSTTQSDSLLDLILANDTLSRQLFSNRLLSEVLVTTSTLSVGNFAKYVFGEAVTIIDTVGRLATYNRLPSDLLNTVDIVVRTARNLQSLIETITSTATIGRYVNQVTNVIQLTGVADTVIRLVNSSDLLSDVLGSSSGSSIVRNVQRAATETVILIDTIGRSALYGRLSTEVMSVIDNLSSNIGAQRLISEIVNTTNTLSRAIIQATSIANVTTVTDSLNRIVSSNRLLSETVNLNTLIITASNVVRLLSTAVSGVDTLASNTVYNRSLLDTTTLIDTLNRLTTYNRLLADIVNATTSILSVRGIIRASSDVLGTIDTLGRFVSYNRLPADTLSIVDTLSRTMVVQRIVTEITTVTFALSRIANQSSLLVNITNIIDTVSRTVLSNRTVSEGLGTNDITIAMGTILRSSSMALTLLDTIARNTVYNRVALESALNSDTVARLTSYVRSLSEVIIVNGVLGSINNLQRTTAEIISNLDTIIRTGNFSRITSEVGNSIDTMTRTVANLRLVSEAITTATTLSRTVAQVPIIANIISMADTVSRTVVNSRTLSESVTAITSLASSTQYQKLVSDTVLSVDTLGRVVRYSRLMADTVTTVDTFFKGSGVRSVVLGEAILVADTVQRSVTQLRSIQDSVLLLIDQTIRSASINRTLSDTILLSNLLISQSVIHDLLQYTSGVIDGSTSVVNNLRTVAETVTTLSTVLTGGQRIALFAESVLSTDITRRVVNNSRLTLEAVLGSDNTVSVYGAFRSLLTSTNITDTVRASGTLTRTTLDVVLAVDQVNRLVLNLRTLADTTFSQDNILSQFFHGGSNYAATLIETVATVLATVNRLAVANRVTIESGTVQDTAITRADALRSIVDQTGLTVGLTRLVNTARTQTEVQLANDLVNRLIQYSRSTVAIQTIDDQLFGSHGLITQFNESETVVDITSRSVGLGRSVVQITSTIGDTVNRNVSTVRLFSEATVTAIDTIGAIFRTSVNKPVHISLAFTEKSNHQLTFVDKYKDQIQLVPRDQKLLNFTPKNKNSMLLIPKTNHGLTFAKRS